MESCPTVLSSSVSTEVYFEVVMVAPLEKKLHVKVLQEDIDGGNTVGKLLFAVEFDLLCRKRFARFLVLIATLFCFAAILWMVGFFDSFLDEFVLALADGLVLLAAVRLLVVLLDALAVADLVLLAVAVLDLLASL